MKKDAIIIWVFAFVALVGGLIGFLKAGSLISLIMSSIISLGLAYSGYMLWLSHQKAKSINLVLLCVILTTFLIRFLMTLKVVPLIMAILTSGVICYLLFGSSKSQRSALR